MSQLKANPHMFLQHALCCLHFSYPSIHLWPLSFPWKAHIQLSVLSADVLSNHIKGVSATALKQENMIWSWADWNASFAFWAEWMNWLIHHIVYSAVFKAELCLYSHFYAYYPGVDRDLNLQKMHFLCKSLWGLMEKTSSSCWFQFFG